MVQSSTDQSKETGSEKLNFEVETEDKHAETQVVNWPFGEEKSEEEEQEEVGYVLARDRTRMEIEQPKRYEYDDIIAFALVAASEVLEEDPKTIKAFLASKEKEKWLSAMNEEIKSLHDNHTWELFKKPPGSRVVSCKWIFKKKEGILGVELDRFKARLVARGFIQKEGIDFNEVFSPVVKHRSIKILMAMVVEFDLVLEQMDVKTTFLYGKLDEVILMKKPKGFDVRGKEDYVCKLNKSVYSLKQSPRQWNRRFAEFMAHIKFHRSHYDNCVYFKFPSKPEFVILLLYVDDILMASNSKSEVEKLKSELSMEF